MKSNSLIKGISLSIIFWVIGILTGVTISKWSLLSDGFYEFKLIDIIRLLITLSIAWLIAFYIRNKVNLSLKKREMIVDVISNFQKIVDDIFDKGNEYIDNPDEKSQRLINICFNSASVSLDMVSDVVGLIPFLPKEKINNLQSGYFQFKASLTDSPFGQKTPIYTDDQIYHFVKSYQALTVDIQKTKLSIYS